MAANQYLSQPWEWREAGMEGRWKEEDGCQCPLPDACVTVRDKVGREARLAAAASC